MARFKITNNMNTRVWAWDLERFEVARSAPAAITMRWDTGREAYDPTTDPWRVVLAIDSGTVEEFTYFNRGGKVIARLTGVDLDADLVRTLLSPQIDNGHYLYDMAVAPGSTFLGAQQRNNQFNRHDDIQTGWGDDVVRAGRGNDYIKDHGGSDLYIGGTGTDTVTYGEWFWQNPDKVVSGIKADLRGGKITGPDGEVDTVKSIESVNGTFLDDVLRGNGAKNFFQGGMGNDLIDGRRGQDQASYRNDADHGGNKGVLVRLDKGFAIDGFGDRDKLRSIEQAQGTDSNDRLFDKRGQNFLDGRDGNDKLSFSKGYDAARGGDGGDTFILRGTASNELYIEDFDPDEGDRLNFLADTSPVAAWRVQNGDTIIEIANKTVILNDWTGDFTDYIL